MFVLREKATNRMRFSRSQSPARNALPASLSPLSRASTDPLSMTILSSPGISSLQFPSSGERLPAGCAFAGQQSPTPSAPPLLALSSKPRTCPSAAKPRTIRTYTTHGSNPHRICTSNFIGLKVIQNQHLHMGPLRAVQKSTSSPPSVMDITSLSAAATSSFCTLTKSPLGRAKVYRLDAMDHEDERRRFTTPRAGHRLRGGLNVELFGLSEVRPYPS